MIRYDYTLERDESDETKVYRPALPNEIPDLAFIQGPNSSGKSTLLNLIALAFFGHRLGPEELNDSLQERLLNLSSAGHQKLEFEIELKSTNADTTLYASKQKDAEDPEVRRIGKDGKSKPISFDQFRREFRLIYDIPQNPLSRLPSLLREIKHAQQDKSSQISRLRKHLTNLIKEVNESKNPNRLAELYRNIETANNRLGLLSSSKEEKEIYYINLRNFISLKNYNDAKTEQTDTGAKIRRLETQISKNSKVENRLSAELLNQQRKTTGLINEAEELQKKISVLLRSLLPKDELQTIQLWEESSCQSEIKSTIDVYPMSHSALYFERYLANLLARDSGKKKEAEFLENLLAVVESYKGQDFEIPGTGLSIKQFITSLKDRYAEFGKITIKTQQITTCQQYLENIRRCFADGTKHYREYVRIAKERGQSIEQLTNNLEREELDESKVKFDHLTKKIQLLKSSLIECGLDYEDADESYSRLLKEGNFGNYISYSEDQLNATLDDLKASLDSLVKEIENCSRGIQIDQNEIDQLEKLGTHKYQDYLIKLEQLFSKVQILEKTLSVDFNRIISDMIDSKLRPMTEQEIAYCNAVQDFLAEKIGNIRHIDKSYKLKKVDVLTKEIVTYTNKKIKFADLGTGQSQGAYIEGLLNANDDKKIIALFDEVAMMDNVTLKPIIEKLQKLYDENKLLAGIVVQKGEGEITVRPLLEMHG